MFTLLNELHFWTFRKEIAIRDTDFGSFCYYEKGTQLDYEFLIGKKSFCEQRGVLWYPGNKRPFKLRDSIRELEGYLESSPAIHCQWKEPDCLLIILNSGLLVSIKINILTGDLEHIHFDKHLLSKLSSENVSDVAVGGSEAVFALSGGRVLAVHYAKSALKSSCKQWITVDSRSCDLVPSSNQQPDFLRLRISTNSTSDKLVVWWAKEDEAWSQTPSLPANFPPIHIYHFSNLSLEPCCCLRTEAQPILVIFSQFRPSILHIIVQIISSRGEICLGWSQMDISTLRIDRWATVQPHRTVLLHSPAATVSLSPSEDKLFIACLDSTLIVSDYSYDYVVTNKTTLGGVRIIAWHPDSCILVAGDDKARIQFFDASLSPIPAQFNTDQHSPSVLLDIGSYFRNQPTLLSLSWNKKPSSCKSTIQIDAFLFLHFERGPLGVLKLAGGSRPGFPVDSIICHYLADGCVEEAVSLLSTISWNFAGSVALACLQSITSYLLIRPLTPSRHGLLDKAIGSYFDSRRSISRVTCMEFNDSVTDIRRKIFYHLLRHQVYESSFKLAVELGHYDLLMDLHNQAKANGSLQLASAALQKAEQISEYSSTHSRCSASSHSSYESSCSWCSKSSCSQCQDEEVKEKVSLKKNIKEECKSKNCKDKNTNKENVKNIKTKCSNEESSSAASSKTSLLHYMREEENSKKEDINRSTSCLQDTGNTLQSGLKSKIQGVECEKGVHIYSNEYREESIDKSYRDDHEFKNHIDLNDQELDDCIRINILDITDDISINNHDSKNNNIESNENLMYSDKNGDLNGRISAEYDRDCLSDVETGSHNTINGGVSNSIDMSNEENHTYVNRDQWSLCNSPSNINGIGSLTENGLLKKNQDFHLDTPQVHASSLWGRDKVHVQNLVGEQWSGSPIRVTTGKRSNYVSDKETISIPTTTLSMDEEGNQIQINQPMMSRRPLPPFLRKDNQLDKHRDDTLNDVCSASNVDDYEKLALINNTNGRTPECHGYYNSARDERYERDTSRLWKTSQDCEWNRPPPPLLPPLPRNTNQGWNDPYSESDYIYKQMNPSASGTTYTKEWSKPSNNTDLNRQGTDFPTSSGFSVNGLFNRHIKNASTIDQDNASNLPPARIGPNLWLNSDNGAGIFWPKPYLGPRERPPPPPPPRTMVHFSDNVTHISLPHKESFNTPIEGNFNTVGLPDTEMFSYPSQRRPNPINKSYVSTYPTQDSNQENASNEEEDGSKVKVVHFGVV